MYYLVCTTDAPCSSTHPGLDSLLFFLAFFVLFDMQLMCCMESSLELPPTKQRWMVPLFVLAIEV